MPKDDILDEVRAAREALGERFGFDLGALARFLRDQERAAGVVPVSFALRREEAAADAEGRVA